MSKLNLKAKLVGVGSVNSGYVYLENLPTGNSIAVPINLSPKNSARKEWNNNNITIEVNGTLDIQLNVHAFKGTDWTFTITNKDTLAVIISMSGTTGSKPEDGLNVSIDKKSVNI